MMFCQLAIAVGESSQVGEVRRHANRIAMEAGLNAEAASNAAIVATELANNLAHYAQKGQILLRSYGANGSAGIEVLSIDRGPGMSNVSRCLADGYSTGGTPGAGLGAVQRLSSEFDIFSSQPAGTVIVSRIQQKKQSPPVNSFNWGVINLPAPHETECGDTWRFLQRPGEMVLMLADGLGHGPLAAKAADLAGKAFEEEPFRPTSLYFSRADQHMRGSRGAAVAVAHIQAERRVLKYAGVGNIAGSLKSTQGNLSKGLVSLNGTVGVEMRKVQEFVYECPDQSTLIMHSDGLQNRWSLEDYPGLIQRHPAVIAAVLYRDFLRGRDDVTVAVVKYPAAV